MNYESDFLARLWGHYLIAPFKIIFGLFHRPIGSAPWIWAADWVKRDGKAYTERLRK